MRACGTAQSCFPPCIGERERRERRVKKVFTLMLHVLRAENPKYDSTEWQELQKQYGNLERTNRDLLREDEEEEAKAVAKMVIEQAVSVAEHSADQITAMASTRWIRRGR
jgi:hypothetical protein